MNSNSSIVEDSLSQGSLIYFTSLWIRLLYEILVPNIVIIGLITNALVIIVMPKKEVAVGSSAKIYSILLSNIDINQKLYLAF